MSVRRARQAKSKAVASARCVCDATLGPGRGAFFSQAGRGRLVDAAFVEEDAGGGCEGEARGDVWREEEDQRQPERGKQEAEPSEALEEAERHAGGGDERREHVQRREAEAEATAKDGDERQLEEVDESERLREGGDGGGVKGARNGTEEQANQVGSWSGG
eukprot:6186898-Pleurochrysis_carterae.AAC.5